MSDWSWQLDGWIVAAGACCAAASALLGNFLVLRKMSLLGDAISHAVLPGLAVAFFATASRTGWPMFAGAAAAGLLTALATDWIREHGRVDEGAAMGVVFTSLFALGLIMIVRAADRVDLDPGCVLYGAIEFTPLDRVRLLGLDMPRAVAVLGSVAVLNALFVGLFFKELKVASFDPALATASGFSASALHLGLMVLVAVTTVASFEAVGSVLVVAMFVVPPAAALLLTDRLGVMVVLSVLFAVASAAAGHTAAVTVPGWFGFGSTGTAGMMAVAAGMLLTACVLLGPRSGAVVRAVRRARLSRRIAGDDVLALLFRLGERGEGEESVPAPADPAAVRATLGVGRVTFARIVRDLRRRGLVENAGGRLALTAAGRDAAGSLVRSHRLWEEYLATHAGVPDPALHDRAHRLEHFTDRRLRGALDAATDAPATDPHGAPIPPEPPAAP